MIRQVCARGIVQFSAQSYLADFALLGIDDCVGDRSFTGRALEVCKS